MERRERLANRDPLSGGRGVRHSEALLQRPEHEKHPPLLSEHLIHHEDEYRERDGEHSDRDPQVNHRTVLTRGRAKLTARRRPRRKGAHWSYAGFAATQIVWPPGAQGRRSNQP